MAPRTIPRTSNNESSSTSSHPDPQSYVGSVESTIEAMRLVYAASKGVVPRTTRRLTTNAERKRRIKSGAVFIFSVEESGIRRWTDGRQWSASRVAGNFLIYRELAEKKSDVKDFDRFEELIVADGMSYSEAPSRYAPSSRKPAPSTSEDNVQMLKEDGLSKKTITVKIKNVDFHLISYYMQHDVDNGTLARLSSRADITAIMLEPEDFKFDDFRYPPTVIVDADGRSPKIICDSDPVDSVDSIDVVGNTQGTAQSSDHRTGVNDTRASLSSWTASTGSKLQEGGSSVPNERSPAVIHQPGYDDVQQPGHDESGPGISSGNTWDHGQRRLPTLRPPDQFNPDYVDWNSSTSSTHPHYRHPIDRFADPALPPIQPLHSPGYDGPGDGREGRWYAQRDMEPNWHEGQMEVAAYGSQEAQQFVGVESLLGLPSQNSNPVPGGSNVLSGQYIPQHSALPTTTNYSSLQQANYYQEYHEALPTSLEGYLSFSNRHSNPDQEYHESQTVPPALEGYLSNSYRYPDTEFQDEGQQHQDGYEEYR